SLYSSLLLILIVFLFLLVFLFYRSVPHPYLHSFPTRRSSDLADFELLDRFLDLLAARPLHPVGGARRHRLGSRHAGAAPLRVALDRKSTRLNSSHQIISYAVFCLKKKKTQQT